MSNNLVNILEKRAILLVNLGSPNELTIKAINKFLVNFLTNKRVVNLPKFLWNPILHGIILPKRSKKLLRQYNKIWIDNDSPLIYFTKLQARKLQELISKNHNNTIVEYAFSSSSPSIQEVLTKLHNKYKLEQLTVLPLYPQHSSTTTSVVFDEIYKFYKNKNYLTTIKFIQNFYNNKYYIDALTNKIQSYCIGKPQAEKIIFSYHSLPKNIIAKGDSYYDECLKTSELLAKSLNLNNDQYIVTFQSKFGYQKWLGPATSTVLTSLAKNKVESIRVICPGFISDCLETLEEIAITNKDLFITHGGLDYTYIPCLNDDDAFIHALNNIIKSV